MRHTVVFAWLLLVLGAACSLAQAPAAARLVAAAESAPSPYIGWADRIIPADKAIGLWLDKEQYDTLDVVAGAYVVLRVASVDKLAKPALWLVLDGAGEGGPRSEQVPFTLPAPELRNTEAPAGIFGLALDIDLQAIPVGTNLKLSGVLRDGDTEVERVDWPFRKVEQPAPPRGKVAVGFSVVNQNPDAASIEPVFVGIPLPKGALDDPANTRLLDALGKEVPAQIDAGTRWNRQGSVRWLGVRFVATHPCGVTSTAYTLEYGTEVRSSQAVTAAVRLIESDAAIEIVTGPLRVIVPRNTGQTIQTVSLDANGDGTFAETEMVAQAGSDGGPYLVDETGTRYAAVLDTAPDITVEERGPIRAVVRVESWYVDDDGTRLCKHITRLRAYAGLTQLDLSHGWLMTAQSEEARFSDIGFALTVPGAKRLALAGEPDKMLYGDITASGVSRYLLQDRWNHFGIHMDFTEVSFADPKQRTFVRTRMTVEGAYSEGWGALVGPRGGVAVGCEDFWQNYPKEIGVANDRLSFHVWPAHAPGNERPVRADELNNLYWLHEAQQLNFKVPPEIVNFPEKNWHTSKYFLNFAKRVDAMGTMKTHEVRLVFFPSGTENPALRAQMRAALQPTVVCVDPKAMVGSGVFGPISAQDTARNPDEERALDATVKCEARLEEMDRAYGMFIFGDGFSNYEFGEQRFGVYRNWRNSHHGCCRTPWLLFFRSGDPFFFQRGLRNARKVMDGGMCHYIPPEKTPAPSDRDGWQVKVIGGLHDYKGYVPWSAGGRVADYNSMTDFLVYFSRFTGDPRGLEVAREWWRGVTDWVGPGGSARSQAGTLSAAIDLYTDTWDRRMLPFIHAEFAGLCTGWDAKNNRFSEWQNYAPWLERYWYLTGSQNAKTVLVRWADAFCEGYGDISSEWGPNGLNILAAATLATGEEKYLRRANWLAYHLALSVGRDVNSIYDGYAFPFAEGISLNNYFQQELPYVLEARNRFGRDVGRPDDSSFAIHPVREDPKLGQVTEWWFLDEKDEPIPMFVRVKSSNIRQVHLTVQDPDGKTVLEQDVPLDIPHAHGYNTYYARLRLELAPDGKRGVYHGLLSDKSARFAATAPIAVNAKEVYPAKDGTVGIRCGRAAFAVPANSGIYTVEAQGKGTPGPFYLQDASGNNLACGWTPNSAGGKVVFGDFPFTFDSAQHQVLQGLANWGDGASFTLKGQTPPKYYAVSPVRLFDPEAAENTPKP